MVNQEQLCTWLNGAQLFQVKFQVLSSYTIAQIYNIFVGRNVTRLSNISSIARDRFTLHNLCLKLSHATCLQLELYCVNQAHNSATLLDTFSINRYRYIYVMENEAPKQSLVSFYIRCVCSLVCSVCSESKAMVFIQK